MKKIIFLFVLIGLTFTAYAQIDLKDKLRGYVNPAELVTLSENIPFEQAILVISKVSEKTTGKKVLSLVGDDSPIGLEINNMQFMKALTIIVQYKNYMYEETPTSIIVKKKESEKNANLGKDVYAPVDEREVKISALMFEANVSAMRERGINWQYLLSRSGLKIGSELITIQDNPNQNQSGGTTTGTGTSTTTQNPPQFNISNQTDFTMGKFDGTVTGLFRFFEDENLGEIISMPTVSVRNGIEGMTQVGSDISIKERDFAGNLIDKFYSTGTIINVTPYIYNEQGVNYILLKLHVERSSATPGVLSTEIQKTQANTSVLLLDGEETVIGGLYVNEETVVRRGIPFLKDLPWWFFGLRYIFGYDSKQTTKKEVIILIKANILPTLKERASMEKKENVLKQQHEENLKQLEKYKPKSEKNDN
ncbi:type II secretion system protein GspD [Melioribacteraceae bacterium 4301-Me]|uniref:type II secretion system protein GspD n=1 Tax=Pyranulibacter aquaticus TaxID=3163344 RepID=UPI0035980C4D